LIEDKEVLEYYTRLLRKARPVLFGRITYQLMVPCWPNIARNQSETEAENGYARVLELLDKLVSSTTLKHVGRDNTRILSASVAEEALALKQQPGKDIYVRGLSIATRSIIATSNVKTWIPHIILKTDDFPRISQLECGFRPQRILHLTTSEVP
jgi:dihydrofolate reductase